MIQRYCENEWMCFVLLMGVAFLTSMVMSVFASKFRTHFGVTRRFSIIDLEFPSSMRDFQKIVNGIYRMPESAKILTAVKASLWVDFLFMPAIYGSIYILCMNVSEKMESSFGEDGFRLFAWLQLVAWILDIVENLFILTHLKEVKMDQTYVDARWRGYKWIVHTKWIIALLGGICSSMVLLCFWLEGEFDQTNLRYLIIFVAECILFVWLLKRFSSQKKCKVVNS